MLITSNDDKELMNYHEKSSNCVFYFEHDYLTWENAKAKELNNKELLEALEDVEKSFEVIDIIKLDNEVLTYYCYPANSGSFIEIIQNSDFGNNKMLSYYASTIMNDTINNTSRDLIYRLKRTYYVLEDLEAYEELKTVDDIFLNSFKVMRTVSMYKDYNVLLNKPLKREVVNISEELNKYCVEISPYFFSNKMHDNLISPDSSSNMFEYSIDIKNHIASIDIEKLKKSLTHLLSNAFYFTSPGNSVKLNAKIENDILKISVLDKGVGIDPSQINQIKIPFYSYDPNTEKRAGIGLGLSYVDLYAKKSEGNCVITSSKGQTMVTISIPLEEDETVSKIVKQSELSYKDEDLQKNLILISNVVKMNINGY